LQKDKNVSKIGFDREMLDLKVIIEGMTEKIL